MEKNFDQNLTAKLQKIANLQQSDVPVFPFSSVADIIEKSNLVTEELKIQNNRTTLLLITCLPAILCIAITKRTTSKINSRSQFINETS